MVTEIVQIDTRDWQSRQEILRKGQALVQLLHEAFDAKDGIYCVAENRCIALRNQTHVPASYTSVM